VLYTRQQLVLLLLLLAAAGVGLAVREWRAAYPELAERVERFDRAPDQPSRGGAPLGADPALRSESPGWPPAGPSRPALSRAPQPLDLNRATTDELTRLPGVGPGMARRIVQTRESAGRFASVDDLRRVKGLGGVRFERLRPLVTIAE
jgi:competence ComEA-like helix-hairpin-helix protein